MTMTAAPATQTYHIFVRANQQRVWDAITQPDHSAGYLFGALVETTAEIGSPFRYHSPDRTQLWGDETVLDAEPPHRLVVSYRGLYNPDLADEPASRVSWQIDPPKTAPARSPWCTTTSNTPPRLPPVSPAPDGRAC